MVKPLAAEDLAHSVMHAKDAFQSLANGRIFLTGGTGFFGHWLLESLLYANRELSLNVQATVLTRDARAFKNRSPHIADNAAVTLLEGDVKNFTFPDQSPTHIIHAATDSSGKQTLQPHLALAESIVDGTRRVLQYGVSAGTQRFLYISSGAVYGRKVTSITHVPETFCGSPDPLDASSSHDEGKRMAEQFCIAYAEGTTLEPVIARCFAFVGPHLPLDTHFAIGNFLSAALHNLPIDIKGDGTPYRSWLYMSDLVVWLWTLLARGKSGRAYNVGSDEEYSIASAARLVAQTLRPDGKGGSSLPVHVQFSPEAAAAVNRYVPSIERVQQELRLSVTVPLPDAVRRTARWHGFPA